MTERPVDPMTSPIDRFARVMSRRGLVWSGLSAIALGLGIPALDPFEVEAKRKSSGKKGKPKRKKTCKHGQKKCGKQCVNLKTSKKHCGVCGNACQPHEHCAGGACWYNPIKATWDSNTGLQLNHTGGLAFNAITQRLLVADTYANEIAVVSLEGERTGSWGSGKAGAGANDFNGPIGAAVGLFGTKIYIVETYNDRIKVVNNDGKFVAHWGSHGNGWGQLDSPGAVAVSPDGSRIYVADTGNNRIKVMDTTGAVLDTWGGEGSGLTQLRMPSGVTVSPDGQSIYVADRDNHRIKRYAPDGTVLDVVGGKGDALGKFDTPVTVACDPNGTQVYVVDLGNARIHELTSDLTPVTLWAQGQVSFPYGITMIAARQFVVTDVGRLHKFVLP